MKWTILMEVENADGRPFTINRADTLTSLVFAHTPGARRAHWGKSPWRAPLSIPIVLRVEAASKADARLSYEAMRQTMDHGWPDLELRILSITPTMPRPVESSTNANDS